jgi:hypothetical protein
VPCKAATFLRRSRCCKAYSVTSRGIIKFVTGHWLGATASTPSSCLPRAPLAA